MSPEVGEFVLWSPPGPVILQIEGVGAYDLPMDAWYVQAGGWQGWVRHDPDGEVPWLRVGEPDR